MEQFTATTSTTDIPTTSAPSTATSTTTFSSVLSRAQAMISQPESNGAFSRLGRRERLRATSSLSASNPCRQNPPKPPKKQKNKRFLNLSCIVDVQEGGG